MHFLHFYEEEFWVIEPLEVNRFRNARKSLLIGYEIKFVGIHPLGEGEHENKYSMSTVEQFQPPIDTLLMNMQIRLIALRNQLAIAHLLLGVFGASDAALKAISVAQAASDEMLSNVNRIQLGGIPDPIEIAINAAQAVLRLASYISASMPTSAMSAAVLALIAALNTVGLSGLQLTDNYPIIKVASLF